MREISKQDKLLNKILPPQRMKDCPTYRRSRFVIPFEYSGRSFLFNLLTKQCFELDAPFNEDAVFSRTDIEDDPALKTLAEGYFLFPEDSDENKFYLSLSTALRAYFRQNGYTTYTVLPTFACNARCVYCYEEGSKPTHMTEETADRTVDFILRTKKKDAPILLSWFGGEPLLGEKIIDRITNGLREKGVEFYSTIITNGSLINGRIIKKMTDEWRIGTVQISIDGLEDDYIRRKRYYSYDNTFEKVLENINALAEAGINVNLRCNIDTQNAEDIPKVIGMLAGKLTKKEKITLYFSALNEVRASEDNYRINELIEETKPLIAEAGFKSNPRPRPGLSFRVFRCMADRITANVVIGPSGELSPCLESNADTVYGNITEGVTDKTIFGRYAQTGPVREKCADCPYLPDCTAFANCPVVDRHCREIRKENIARFLLDLAERSDKADAPLESELNPEERDIKEKMNEIIE